MLHVPSPIISIALVSIITSVAFGEDKLVSFSTGPKIPVLAWSEIPLTRETVFRREHRLLTKVRQTQWSVNKAPLTPEQSPPFFAQAEALEIARLCTRPD